MSKCYDIERTSQGFDIEEADKIISELIGTLENVIEDYEETCEMESCTHCQNIIAIIRKAKGGM